jgi:hypothetical protein
VNLLIQSTRVLNLDETRAEQPLTTYPQNTTVGDLSPSTGLEDKPHQDCITGLGMTYVRYLSQVSGNMWAYYRPGEEHRMPRPGV